MYFLLLLWLLLCIKFKGMPVYTNDDAIVFLVVVVSIASNSPFCLERYLLHLPTSWNVRIPRYYVTRSQWPCVFKCRLSRVSVFFLFLVCVLFSGPSRLFDDFSGESNDHKQNKIKEKTKKKKKNPAWCRHRCMGKGRPFWAAFKVIEDDGFPKRKRHTSKCAHLKAQFDMD